MTCCLMESGTGERLPDNFVYANDWYVIIPNDEGIGYKIVNIRTDVVEGITEVLPSAVSKSDVWRDLMEETAQKKAAE